MVFHHRDCPGFNVGFELSSLMSSTGTSLHCLMDSAVEYDASITCVVQPASTVQGHQHSIVACFSEAVVFLLPGHDQRSERRVTLF